MKASHIIRALFINFGLMCLGIQGTHLGLLSPIEVVEEYGCHDTELRLTCGDLDSKLAILEAVFMPNCTHDECLQLDMRRLIRTLPFNDSAHLKNAEKEAGEKFLDTLRKSNSKEENIDINMLEENKIKTELKGPKKHHSQPSLRLVLEQLIIRYLRRISPEEDTSHDRFSRSRRNLDLNVNDTVSHLNKTFLYENEENEGTSADEQSPETLCNYQGRHVTALNILDFEKSYQNQSDNVYNIRSVLNKRCSGKNHCSFVFATDHPFAKIWEGGTVRVKYICMEEFRVNQYCGEHLTIGYELDPNIQVLKMQKGDPIAEARIQPRETSLHSLKIIKTDTSNLRYPSKHLNYTLQDIQSLKISKQNNAANLSRNGVYSQDFRLLKILPNNLDNLSDIETVGNHIYFKKDSDPSEQILSAENNTSISTYIPLLSTPPATDVENANEEDLNEDLELNQISDQIMNNFENITLTIREGGHYITVYSKVNTSSTSVSVIPSQEEFRNESTTDDGPEVLEPTISNVTINKTSHATEFKFGRFFTDNESSTFNSALYFDTIKKAFFRSPLLHGFAMTPGYPKFYIGDFDCYWDIYAPEDVKIRISILDNSLRSEEGNCKDYLQIEDVGTNKTLFHSCKDVLNPVGIGSYSNWVKVTMRVTSKFAYPKRGVLLHYTADGCVPPPLPKNVKLLDRTTSKALYECMPSFIFPDSRISTRELNCNKLNIWDKLLPDCVAQELSRSGKTSEEKLPLLDMNPEVPILENKMPSQPDADTLFDIVIPSILITSLLLINGAIFAIIMKYRKRSKILSNRGMELAEL